MFIGVKVQCTFTSNRGRFAPLPFGGILQLRCSYSYICLYFLCLRRLGWYTSRRIFVYILHANHQSQLRCFPWWNTHNFVVRIRTFAYIFCVRVDSAGIPAGVYSQSALSCYLLIYGHSSNKKSETSELASDSLLSSLSTLTSFPCLLRRLALLVCPL